MEVKMKSLLLAKGVLIFCQCYCFGQKWNIMLGMRYVYDSGIVLNIVIPPLVTSCKILIISVNFLAALAARRGWFQTLLLPLSNSNFWGFPLSQVSVVLLSAKNVVNAFFCFVLSPIVAVLLDAKVTYQSSLLTSALLSRYLSTFMQHLYPSCWTTFSNEQFVHLDLL